MSVPVLEKFAEDGCQLFINPSEAFEDFRASGVFRRACISSPVDSSEDIQLQREALFDVALVSGLASIICEYITESYTMGTIKTFYLKDPIAVQNWVIRSIETIRHTTRRMIEDVITGRRQVLGTNGGLSKKYHTECIKLHGLRSILYALMKRFSDGILHQFQQDSTEANLQVMQDLSHKGLCALKAKIKELQGLLYQIQICIWLDDHGLVYDLKRIQELYQTRRHQKELHMKRFMTKWKISKEEFHDLFGHFGCFDSSQSSCLLINWILEHAQLKTLCSYPIQEPFSLLNCFNITDEEEKNEKEKELREKTEFEMEMDLEIEMNSLTNETFSIELGILLYTILDLTFLSLDEEKEKYDKECMLQMKTQACSFASTVGLDNKMQSAIFAIWLIDTYNEETHLLSMEKSSLQVSCPWISNAVQILSDKGVGDQLETDLCLLILNHLQFLNGRMNQKATWRLFHSFRDLISSKIQHADGKKKETCLEFKQLGLIQLTLALESDMWEHALHYFRQFSTCLTSWKDFSKDSLIYLVFGMILEWFEQHNQFHDFLFQPLLKNEEDLLQQILLKRGTLRSIDLLIGYYLRRNQMTFVENLHKEQILKIQQLGKWHLLEQDTMKTRQALIHAYQKTKTSLKCTNSMPWKKEQWNMKFQDEFEKQKKKDQIEERDIDEKMDEVEQMEEEIQEKEKEESRNQFSTSKPMEATPVHSIFTSSCSLSALSVPPSTTIQTNSPPASLVSPIISVPITTRSSSIPLSTSSISKDGETFYSPGMFSGKSPHPLTKHLSNVESEADSNMIETKKGWKKEENQMEKEKEEGMEPILQDSFYQEHEKNQITSLSSSVKMDTEEHSVDDPMEEENEKQIEEDFEMIDSCTFSKTPKKEALNGFTFAEIEEKRMIESPNIQQHLSFSSCDSSSLDDKISQTSSIKKASQASTNGLDLLKAREKKQQFLKNKEEKPNANEKKKKHEDEFSSLVDSTKIQQTKSLRRQSSVRAPPIKVTYKSSHLPPSSTTISPNVSSAKITNDLTLKPFKPMAASSDLSKLDLFPPPLVNERKEKNENDEDRISSSGDENSSTSSNEEMKHSIQFTQPKTKAKAPAQPKETKEQGKTKAKTKGKAKTKTKTKTKAKAKTKATGQLTPKPKAKGKLEPTPRARARAKTNLSIPRIEEEEEEEEDEKENENEEEESKEIVEAETMESLSTVGKKFDFMKQTPSTPQRASKLDPFSTPDHRQSKTAVAKRGTASVPVRRNPRRSARKKY